MLRKALSAVVAMGFATATMADAPPPLPVEPVGVVEKLPAQYPEDWFLVQDASFFHMSDGKVYVIDTSKDSVPEQVQGSFNVVLMGNILHATDRGEIYAVETFHTRGTRGDRFDVLTVWDTVNLSPVAEIKLPTGKRFMGMPERNAMKLLNDGKWLAIFNFSPATSVTLIDLDQREIIGEVAIPGCSFIYPAGGLGFSSLCADGRFMTTLLNSDGSIKSQKRGDKFFDSDTSPIFERAAIVGSTGYFPSFSGQMFPVDFSGDVAQAGKPWPMAADVDGDWAPGGIGIEGEDANGHIYFLMGEGNAVTDGGHNAGGSEVWVFDPNTQKRVKRIALQEWGLSLAVNGAKDPKVLVTNPVDMSVELYDANSGEFVRKITGFGQETPLYLQAAQ